MARVLNLHLQFLCRDIKSTFKKVRLEKSHFNMTMKMVWAS